MQRPNRRIPAAVGACLIFGVLAARGTEPPKNPDVAPVPAGMAEPKVWFILKPLQCMDNPWEQDWLARNKKRVAKYPREQEHEIVKAYFAKRGVKIWEVRTKAYVPGAPRCTTCGCERGDRLSLSVSGSDVSKMKSLGYDDFLPEESLPGKGTTRGR